MEKYLNVLKTTLLFKGIEEKSLLTAVSCLNAAAKKYKSGEFVFRAGEKIEQVGIVLSGKAQVIREDIDGRKTIIAALSAGELFGEAFCCAGTEEIPISVICSADSEVLLISYSKIFSPCEKACDHHLKLIKNLLETLARKNIMLQSKLEILSKRTIREKVLAFLEINGSGKSKKTKIPFDREGMADFLCIDRTALSHELSRMKKDGLINYQKNRFEIL